MIELRLKSQRMSLWKVGKFPQDHKTTLSRQLHRLCHDFLIHLPCCCNLSLWTSHSSLVHSCTIFLCYLDGEIWWSDDQCRGPSIKETLPKAQRTRGLSSSCQSHIASSNTNFDRILSSESWLSINKTSASPLNLKFKILTQPSFRISTKIQLHNLYKTSATKCWTSSSFKILLNFNFKILTNPCAQSLKKKFSFRTKRQLPNL